MARRVFLSVLGTGFYEPCSYENGDFVSAKTRFIQLATIEYLNIKEWTANDAVIILLTEEARKTNWEKQTNDKRQNHKKDEEEYFTLKQLISEAGLPMQATPVDIPVGKDEKEMWDIFQKLFDNIQEDDELYIDLTHSFRYIPMMMMVFSNYAKFLKGVKVKSVTYGNFEVFKSKQSETGLIVDITSLSQLQDWTAGADEFLSSGRVDKLRGNYIPQLDKRNRDSGYKDKVVHQQKNLLNHLDTVVNDFITCRGKSIVEGKNMKILQSDIQEAMNTEMPEPFRPLLKKISDSFASFSSSRDVLNGIKAARWCFDHQLYQQCTTLLRETIDTYICEESGAVYTNLKARNRVNAAYYFFNNKRKGNNVADDEHAVQYDGENNDGTKEMELAIADKMKQLDFWNQIDMDILESLVTTRNDFNHCGMLDDSMKDSKKIIDKIGRYLNYLETFFKE